MDSIVSAGKKVKGLKFRPIDGATITPYVTTGGYTPEPPNIAYGQMLFGGNFVNGGTTVVQAVAEGMVTLREDGFEKVRMGLTSIEEVLRVVV